MHPFSHSSSITTQPSKHSSRSDKEVDATWNAIWQNLLAHTTRRVAVIRYMVSWDTIQTTFCDPSHVTKKTDPDGKLAKSAPHRTLAAFIIISAECSNKAYPPFLFMANNNDVDIPGNQLRSFCKSPCQYFHNSISAALFATQHFASTTLIDLRQLLCYSGLSLTSGQSDWLLIYGHSHQKTKQRSQRPYQHPSFVPRGTVLWFTSIVEMQTLCFDSSTVARCSCITIEPKKKSEYLCRRIIYCC